MSRERARVGLVKTGNRRKNVFQALELVKDDVIRLIKEDVVIKPNFFDGRNELAVTHVDAVYGTLDFLSTLPNPPKKVTIAGSPNGKGFEEVLKRFGYIELPDNYDIPIEFVDFNSEKDKVEAEVIMADERKEKVRISKLVADSDCIVSVAIAKTHDVCFATFGYKNVAIGSVYEPDRIKMHGYYSHYDRRMPKDAIVLNINLIKVARYLKPHIAVIDGTVALEGNGPGGGDTVDFGIAAASVDVFAADAVVTKAMGFEPMEMGFLYYANSLCIGVADLEKIDVLGRSIQEVAMKFKPHRNYEFQSQWKTGKAEVFLA